MLEQGTIVGGKYRLVSQIGVGGMGVVWKATHEHLGHDIAVKFLTHLATSVDGLVARFLDEARTAASVRHRNVVHILDFGVTEDHRPYMVMEFLEGESLADRLERTPPLNLVEITQTMALTLSGLAAVHDRGIIHRDLKPENIFLTYDADGFFPKILDFGVSKDVVRDEDGNRGVRTRDGVLLGTPQYMSPEQARGLRDIDIRTDVYSMGAILYETLAGVRPYDSENVGDILMDVIKGHRKHLGDLRPDLPRPLVEVVERAMTIDRAERYQDAREMRNSLFAATAVSRPDAFGITDPTGSMNRELASAVARALQAQAPQDQSILALLPHTPMPVSGIQPAPASATSTPLRTKLPATSVDSTIPFKTGEGDDESDGLGERSVPKSGETRSKSREARTRSGESTRVVTPDTSAPAAQSRVGRYVFLTLLLVGGSGVAALEYQTPGLVRASVTRALIRLHDALPSGAPAVGAGVSSDAGVAEDAAVDAGVIHVRLRQVPTDAVLIIDGRTYSPAEVDALRAPDGGMVAIEVVRRRELYDIRVEAPGFEPFEGRRYATASVLYRLRMRAVEDAGTDAGDPLDAGVDAADPDEPSPRHPTRRRRH